MSLPFAFSIINPLIPCQSSYASNGLPTICVTTQIWSLHPHPVGSLLAHPTSYQPSVHSPSHAISVQHLTDNTQLAYSLVVRAIMCLWCNLICHPLVNRNNHTCHTLFVIHSSPEYPLILLLASLTISLPSPIHSSLIFLPLYLFLLHFWIIVHSLSYFHYPVASCTSLSSSLLLHTSSPHSTTSFFSLAITMMKSV